MADTPSGSDVVKLGISVDSTEAASADKALDHLNETTVRVVKGLDDLEGASTRSKTSLEQATQRYETARLTLTGLAEATRELALVEEQLEAVRQANLATGTAMIAKLEELIKTFGMSQEQIMRVTAAEIGMSEAIDPLIAKLEALKVAQQQNNIQQGRDVEMFNQQTRLYNERIALEQKRDVELNAIRQKELLDYVAWWEKTIAIEEAGVVKQNQIQQGRDVELNRMRNEQLIQDQRLAERQIEIQQQRDVVLNEMRNKEMVQYVAWWEKQLAAQEATQKQALVLAEKQAIEEIRWTQMSVDARIKELERLRLWQANSAIRPETIAANFSGAAINDLPNLTRMQREYNGALRDNKVANVEAAVGARGFSEAVKDVTFSNKLAYRELLVLGHEGIQGSWKRMVPSMMVLAEYTNLASLALTGLGAGMLAAVVGLGAMAFAVVKGLSQQKEFTDALIMTGNYAGTTAEGLHKMAVEAAGASGSIGEAKKAVAELAGTGKFTADQIGVVSQAVVDLEHATGQSIETTIKQFESLQVQVSTYTNRTNDSISKSLVKLDDQYHFLTLSVYEQIRSLEEEGKQKEASAMATNEFARVTEARAAESVANLGHIENAWKGIKHWIGEAIDAMGEWGKKAGPEAKVVTIQKQIEGLQEFMKKSAGAGSSLLPNPSQQKALEKMKELNEQLTAAQVNLLRENERAYAQSERALTQTKAVHAAQQIASEDEERRRKSVSTLTNALERNKTLEADIRAADPNDPSISEKAIADRMAATIKENTQRNAAATKGLDDRRNLLKDALIVEQTAFDSEKAIFTQREQMLDTYHKKFKLDDADFFAGRKAARDEYIKAEQASFEKESAVIASFKSKNPNEVAARQAQQSKLLQDHQKFLATMREADVKDAADAVALQQKKLDDMDAALQKSGDKELADLDKSIEKHKQHNIEIGKTKEEIELARQAQTEATTELLQGEADAISALLTESDLQNVLQGQYRDMYQQRLNYLELIIAKRKEDAQLSNEGAALEATAAVAKEAEKEWNRVNRKIGDDLASAIVDGGGNGVKKLIKDMETAFAKAVLRPFIEPIAGAFASFAAGSVSAGNVASGGAAGGLAGGANAFSILDGVKNLYTTISGGFAGLSSSVGGMITKFGDFIGSEATTSFGLGMQGAGEFGATGAGAYGSMAGTALGYLGGIGGGIGLGSLISGQFGSMVTNVAGSLAGAAIGSQIGMIGGPLGAVIGGAIGGILNRAFGMGDVEVRGQGVEGAFGPGGFSGNTFVDTHQDGGWFRGDSNEHQVAALSQVVVNQFTNSFSLIKSVTSDFAKALGLDANTIANYTQAISVQLTGDNSKDQAAITKLFTDMADNVASAVAPTIMLFSKQGETAGAVLQRLGTSLTAVNSMFGTLGQRLLEVSLQGADTASKLVDLFGGLSSMQQVSSTYFQAYFTEQERIAITTQQLTAHFADLGFAMPTSELALRAQIEAQDLSTDAGRKSYVQLMNLAVAYAQLNDVITQSQAAITQERKGLQDQLNELTMSAAQLLELQRNALDESNRALFDQVQAAKAFKDAQDKAKQDLQDAYDNESTAIQNTIDKLKSFSQTMKDFGNSLLIGDLSPLTPQQQYEAARQQFQETAAAARGGDSAAQGNLTNVANAFLNASKIVNASDLQFQQDFGNVKSVAEEMVDWANSQVSAQQSSLELLNQQVQGLVDIKVAVLSVAQAIENLANVGIVPNSTTQFDANGFMVPNTGAFATQGGFSPLNYSQMGTLSMAPLIDEIKMLRMSNDALITEVRTLRAEQRDQTNATITGNYDATNKAADKICAATVDAAKESSWAQQSKPSIV